MPEKETVKVIVRCRPMNSRENKLQCKTITKVDPNKATVQMVKVSAKEMITSR